MRTETTRLYKDLLSLQGHRVDGPVEDELSGLAPAPRRDNVQRSRWFATFLLLGEHDAIDSHHPNDAIVSPEKIGIAHC